MQFKPKKVNPGLFVPERVQGVPYISPFHQFLQGNPLFSNKSKENEKQWRQYPIFLKNSVFYIGENFEKYRKMEVGYKFFVTDELREKGNYRYNKGRYAQALGFYEKAASIMQWLESTPDEFVQKMKRMGRMSREMQQGDSPVSGTTVETANPEKETYEDRLNDLLLTNFSDDNVRLCTGPLSIENGDKEIHDNILFGLYSNIAMCYV
jgi:tetratricopeptide (TPR) repeat protein